MFFFWVDRQLRQTHMTGILNPVLFNGVIDQTCPLPLTMLQIPAFFFLHPFTEWLIKNGPTVPSAPRSHVPRRPATTSVPR